MRKKKEAMVKKFLVLFVSKLLPRAKVVILRDNVEKDKAYNAFYL